MKGMAPPKRKNKRRKRLTFHEKRWNPSHQKSKEKSEIGSSEEDEVQVSENEGELEEKDKGDQESDQNSSDSEEKKEEEEEEEEEEEDESLLLLTSEEERKDEDWTPPSSSHSSTSSRKRKRSAEEKKEKGEYLQQQEKKEESEKREEEGCSSSTEEEDCSFELPPNDLGRTLGAKMMTPPKVLSKMPHLQKTTSSLDDILKDMGEERKKKVAEKERFEDAGWKRIDDLGKWKWTYHKVPSDKKELMIDMEGQGRKWISSLKIFSIYFSDELLSYLLEQREPEMAQHWSPSGYGLTLNLQMIKQVCLSEETYFLILLSSHSFFFSFSEPYRCLPTQSTLLGQGRFYHMKERKINIFSEMPTKMQGTIFLENVPLLLLLLLLQVHQKVFTLLLLLPTLPLPLFLQQQE